MTTSTLVRITACLSSFLSLISCSGPSASTVPCNPGDPGCGTGSGGGAGGSTNGTTTGGASAGGGASGAGGVTSAGGSTANGTASGTGGASSATGGTTATSTASNTGGITSAAGGKTSTGGTSPTGGSASPAGGNTSTGGTSPTGGSASPAGGKTSTGGTTSAMGGSSSAAGGKTSTGGTTSATGGVNATGGASTTGCSATDQGGVALAKAGDSTSASDGYLNLCSVRLINNNWGSVAVQQAGTSCSDPMTVKVNSDHSLGWTFNRPNCGDGDTHPDFPELEFGVAPFGSGSSLLTSPAFSTTTLLPMQVKNITSASVTINNLNVALQNSSNWNLGVEFWLSKNNSATSSDGGVYAEVMAVLGWGANFWVCTTGVSGNVNSGGKSYNLCHQSDTWNSPKTPTWRFFQFELSGGSPSFSGTVDIKAFLDWFFSSSYVSGASKDLWLTRIEVGTEIGDNTSGSCTIGNISFNVNGTSQAPAFAN